MPLGIFSIYNIVFFSSFFSDGVCCRCVAVDARTLTRIDAHKYAVEAYKLGVRYIGGCCGFEPRHIRAMSEAVSKNACMCACTRGLENRHITPETRSGIDFSTCLYMQ